MKRSHIDLSGYIPFLYIWGLQWLADSAFQYQWEWDHDGVIRKVLLGAAVVLSLIFLIRGKRKADSSPVLKSGSMLWAPLAVVCALLGAALLLVFTRGYDLFYADLYRTFVLSVFFIAAGARLGRELVWLGIWLMAATVIVAVRYLGYGPIVLGAAGGFSLLACAVLFRIWSRAVSARQLDGQTGI